MKHLMELTNSCCKWIDEPRTLLYCAEVVVPGTSWCKVHLRQVFRNEPLVKAPSPPALPTFRRPAV